MRAEEGSGPSDSESSIPGGSSPVAITSSALLPTASPSAQPGATGLPVPGTIHPLSLSSNTRTTRPPLTGGPHRKRSHPSSGSQRREAGGERARRGALFLSRWWAPPGGVRDGSGGCPPTRSHTPLHRGPPTRAPDCHVGGLLTRWARVSPWPTAQRRGLG
jgi:hypothetical protein